MLPTVNTNKDWQQSVVGSAPVSTSITSASLQTPPATQYNSPTPTPIYPTQAIPQPDFSLTQPQQQAQDLTTQLQDLNTQLTGESSYRTQQENQLGIPQLNQNITDLTSRLTGLKNEALAIPLQLQNQVQNGGAIVTGGGLQPHQTAALRNNAIQALSTSTLLEAARGNLSTAISQADRAVSQRYDPIREQIAARQANLDIILKSPAYSQAEKQRAFEQQQIQEKLKVQLDNQQENWKTTHAMAAAAIKNNPNNPAAAVAAQQALALNPEDPQYLEKVFALIGNFQTDPVATQTALTEMKLKQEQLRQAPLAFALDQRAKVANIAQSYAAADASRASAAKTRAEMDALKNPGSLTNSQGKPLTDTQATALGYARRVAEAGQTIDTIGANFTSASNYFNDRLPNIVKAPQLQQYEQAKRNFVNAVLRKESGAVISQEEFDNASRQYFPQPGDSADVVAQKKQNRDTVYQNLLIQAGNPTIPQTSRDGETHVYNGKTYKVVNGQWVEQ